MYAPITGVGDGSAPVVNLTFDYLDQAYVKAAVDGAEVPFTWTGVSQITFDDAVAVDADWMVYRDTGISTALVDFMDSSVLTEADLDTSANQLRHHQEEIDARYGTLAEADVSANAAASSAAASASSAAAAASSATAADNSADAAAAAAAVAASAANIPNASANASSRAALALLSASAPAILTETGREGVFVFDSSDLSAEVADDTRQAIYVPPASDTTGASGSWVRRYSGAKDPRWFGAVGDGVTDDAVALQAWLDSGGALHLPAMEFYSSAKLIVRKNVSIQGGSYGFDNRNVDGSATLGYENQPGARIKFAAGVGGLDIQPQTPNTDPSGDVSAVQEGAYSSMIRDIALIGAGTGAAATGLYSRTVVHLVNVHVLKFQGDGFDISATVVADGISEYGNASLSSLTACHAVSNGGDGFRIRGNDANVIKLDTCNAHLNGGWGFNDSALLGNAYTNCHAAGNTSGSFRASSAVAFHTYDGCYIENDIGRETSLTAACIVNGGSMANDVNFGSVDLALRFNAGDMLNVGEIKADNSGVVNFARGFVDFTHDQSYTSPSTGGRIQWNSSSGLALSGVGALYDFGIRNAAGGSVMLVPHNSTSPLFLADIDVTGVVKIGGVQVVSNRQAAIADPSAGATVDAEARTAIGSILTALRTHGLIAP